MAIQFNPHTIAAQEADHHHEFEAFRVGESNADEIEQASFQKKVDAAARTLSDDCVLPKVKNIVSNVLMDSVTPHYGFVLRESLVTWNEVLPTFRLDYTFIRSISVICRFCTAAKEQTNREVAVATGLLPELNQLIVEYLYLKSESPSKEKAERQQTKWAVAIATSFQPWGISNQTIMEYLDL